MRRVLLALLLAVVAATVAPAPALADPPPCEDARQMYLAVAGPDDVLVLSGAQVIDIGGESVTGKTVLESVAGDGVCAGTYCDPPQPPPYTGCQHGYLFVFQYRYPGTYTITAPGFCSRQFTTGTGGPTSFVCFDPLPPPPSGGGTGETPGGDTGETPAELPLCNPARGVRPPGCRDLGITDQRLLDQIAKVGWEVLDALLLDDIRRLQDPNVSQLEKAWIIASYAIPQAKAGRLGVKATKLIAKKAPAVIATLKRAQKGLAQACGVASAAARVAATCRRQQQAVTGWIKQTLQKHGKPVQDVINRKALDDMSRVAKKKGNTWTVKADNPKAAAKQLFRDITPLGQKKKYVGGQAKPGVYVELPGEQTAVLRTKTKSGPPAVQFKDPRTGKTVKVHFAPR